MTYTTTISTKGQVTIPDALRQELGIKSGDKAIFAIENSVKGELKLKVMKSLTLDELGGSLHIPGMKYVPLSVIRKKLAQKQKDDTWI